MYFKAQEKVKQQFFRTYMIFILVAVMIVSCIMLVPDKVYAASYNTTTASNPNLYNQTISACELYNTVLKKDGTVWAWGYNGAMQYIQGVAALPKESISKYSPQYPEQISQHNEQTLRNAPLNDVVSVYSNNNLSVAIKKDGTVWSFGKNPLNSALIPSRPGATLIKGLDNVLKLSISPNNYMLLGLTYHMLVLKKDGTVWALGDNRFGQLGNGITDASSGEAVKVENLNDVVSVAAGNGFSLALKNDGTLWGWGALYSKTADPAFFTTPIQLQVQNVVAVSVSGSSILYINKVGDVFQLSDLLGKVVKNESEIKKMNNLTDIVAIVTAPNHSLALKKDGTVWAWGKDVKGSLGNKDINDIKGEPTQVQGLENVVSISAGFEHSIALKSDGTVWVWGSNQFGALGIGEVDNKDHVKPVQVTQDIMLPTQYTETEKKTIDKLIDTKKTR